MKKDVIVLGAGAAGLMCAIEAGKRGRSVLVLERGEKIGKKIRISGGGRCNFTNRGATHEHFLSKNPHFCKSALARYTAQDFIALVEKHRINYHEKKLGQLFCDTSSEEIVQMLEKECAAAKVDIEVQCEVEGVRKDGGFAVSTNLGTFQADSLVVATGGLSIPKMGATSFAHDLARQFGLKVVPCKPGLVPLTLQPDDLGAFGPLTGVSLDATVRYGKREFRENILFTHKGLSGPAILQISSYWENAGPIFIDLLPEKELMDDLVDGRNKKFDLENVLAKHMPRRVAHQWLQRNAPPRPLLQCSNKELQDFEAGLHRWRVTPAGTEGYDKAEVTAGGVDTDELSSKTMEAEKVPGLYFIGEAVDVTGHLGGYNFQWAWSSGFAAGQAV